MMSIGMHCRLLGRPGRITALQRFLDHIAHHMTRCGSAAAWTLRGTGKPPPLPLQEQSPGRPMALTLEQLNQARPKKPPACWTACTNTRPGLPKLRWPSGPSVQLAQLKHTHGAGAERGGHRAQLALIRAHPELAGKAMVDNSLTAESTNEQSKAGLTHCTPKSLRASSNSTRTTTPSFGFPFILAVRGPRGTGPDQGRDHRHLRAPPATTPTLSCQECLRNIHRIAEIRLNDKFGVTPDWATRVGLAGKALAQHSDPGFAEQGQLTVTYLTDAHRACAQRISMDMRECGLRHRAH
jgi:N-carbamoyl-L-amino-acid hydrolase